MFRMCVSTCERNGCFGPYSIYDPCCGCGTLLTVAGLLNSERIARIVGSDTNPAALATAHNNLALLTIEGVDERLRQLQHDYEAYGKSSHRDAMESAVRIRELVVSNRGRSTLATELLHLDATRLGPQDLDSVAQPEIILSDVPYGIKSQWAVGSGRPAKPMLLLLESLLSFRNELVVAIAADKSTRVEHPRYRRLKRLSAGKRQIVLLRSA